jgi:Cu+-exporting ATPase
VAIPLAVTGNLAPVYAAAAMATSSLFVVANSLRLKSFNMKKPIPKGMALISP